MEWLVISTLLLTWEGENEIMKARVMNLSLDNIGKAIVPGSGTVEVPSTFKSMGVKMQTKQRVEL